MAALDDSAEHHARKARQFAAASLALELPLALASAAASIGFAIAYEDSSWYSPWTGTYYEPESGYLWASLLCGASGGVNTGLVIAFGAQSSRHRRLAADARSAGLRPSPRAAVQWVPWLASGRYGLGVVGQW